MVSQVYRNRDEDRNAEIKGDELYHQFNKLSHRCQLPVRGIFINIQIFNPRPGEKRVKQL